MSDNILKHVRGYELSSKVENCKDYVMNFSGAKVMRLEDYVPPTLWEMPISFFMMERMSYLPKKILTICRECC